MQPRSFTIGDRALCGVRHICCFYDSRQQRSDVFAPYLREGISCGEKVVCIFPRAEHGTVRGDLRGQGVAVDEAEQRGQLQLLTEDETYITGGLFAKDRMADMLEDLLRAARGTEHPHVRTVGEMDWALRNLPGTDDLVDYECAVNALLLEYDCTLACAYDVNRFSARVLADALATHSHIVLNGVVHENPHFVEPAEFKRHLMRRRSGPGAVARA